MNLLPKAGENSPHTGIIRINWEIFPLNSDGTYSNNLPVDIGVIYLKTDGNSFQDCSNKVEAFLNKKIDDKNFLHIWRKGSYL